MYAQSRQGDQSSGFLPPRGNSLWTKGLMPDRKPTITYLYIFIYVIAELKCRLLMLLYESIL